MGGAEGKLTPGDRELLLEKPLPCREPGEDGCQGGPRSEGAPAWQGSGNARPWTPGAATLAQVPKLRPVRPPSPSPRVATVGSGGLAALWAAAGGSHISKGIGAGRRARWKQLLGEKQERWGPGGAGRAAAGMAGGQGRREESRASLTTEG